MTVSVVGGGLAGCEAALWLAAQGAHVRLYEQKPRHFSPAHHSETLAELVCSNSFKAEREDSAGGLLKAEMRLLGSQLLPVADACRVPAGGALAVDRDCFSAAVTALVEQEPNIELARAEVRELTPLLAKGPVLVASGPLTEGALAADIAARCEAALDASTGGSGGSSSAFDRTGDAKSDQKGTSSALLSFYDAAAPIVTADSLDMDRVFAASRYGRGEDDYLNCPFDKPGYEAFHEALLAAETAPLHAFDGDLAVYEGCMPVEVMARRGADTLRYGPLRPVGLRDPRTGHRPWACVQLRRENEAATLYNLVGFQTNIKFSEQQRVFSMIPGLEHAEFVRYGVMHRNTFLNAPRLLEPGFCLKGGDALYFAGQITGFEGYMESAACGLLAARALWKQAAPASARWAPPPAETMCGALSAYIAAPNKDFQPMGANMGLLPPLAEPVKGKRERYAALAHRSLGILREYLDTGAAGGI